MHSPKHASPVAQQGQGKFKGQLSLWTQESSDSTETRGIGYRGKEAQGVWYGAILVSSLTTGQKDMTQDAATVADTPQAQTQSQTHIITEESDGLATQPASVMDLPHKLQGPRDNIEGLATQPASDRDAEHLAKASSESDPKLVPEVEPDSKPKEQLHAQQPSRLQCPQEQYLQTIVTLSCSLQIRSLQGLQFLQATMPQTVKPLPLSSIISMRNFELETTCS